MKHFSLEPSHRPITTQATTNDQSTPTINPPSHHHQPTIINLPSSSTTIIKHHHQPSSSTHHHHQTHWSNRESQNWSNKELKRIKTSKPTNQTELWRRLVVARRELRQVSFGDCFGEWALVVINGGTMRVSLLQRLVARLASKISKVRVRD